MKIIDEAIELEPIPLRNEITVLPADDPNQLKIGWTVSEYLGFKIDDKVANNIRAMIINMKDGESLPMIDYPTVLFTRSSEKSGSIDDGSQTLSLIQIDGDNREAVVCIAYMNKRGLASLPINIKMDI